ncbi:MAG: hypothetical protein ACI9MB_004256, partial [Verrucomicrobiales bacterium]
SMPIPRFLCTSMQAPMMMWGSSSFVSCMTGAAYLMPGICPMLVTLVFQQIFFAAHSPV